MSTIKLTPVSVNGHPINLSPIYVHTCPHGSDREDIVNRVEDRLISQIDCRLMSRQASIRRSTQQ